MNAHFRELIFDSSPSKDDIQRYTDIIHQSEQDSDYSFDICFDDNGDAMSIPIQEFCDCSNQVCSRNEELSSEAFLHNGPCRQCGREQLTENATEKGQKTGQKDKENNSDPVPKYKRKNLRQISLYISESHGLVDTNKLAVD